MVAYLRLRNNWYDGLVLGINEYVSNPFKCWIQTDSWSNGENSPDWASEESHRGFLLEWGRSLRLSSFMSSKLSVLTEGRAGGTAPFWHRDLLDVFEGPARLDRWEVICSGHLCVPLVQSVLVFNQAGGFEVLAFRFCVFISTWVSALDCKSVRGWSVSVIVLVLLCWDMLKGTDLGWGFLVLAFPCSSTEECQEKKKKNLTESNTSMWKTGRRHSPPGVCPPTCSGTGWSQRECEEEVTLPTLEACLHTVVQVPFYLFLASLDPGSQCCAGVAQIPVWKALGLLAFCYFHSSFCADRCIKLVKNSFRWWLSADTTYTNNEAFY